MDSIRCEDLETWLRALVWGAHGPHGSPLLKPSVSKQGRGTGRGGLSLFVEVRKPKWLLVDGAASQAKPRARALLPLRRRTPAPRSEALKAGSRVVSGRLGLKLRSLRELDERLRGEGGRFSAEISKPKKGFLRFFAVRSPLDARDDR